MATKVKKTAGKTAKSSSSKVGKAKAIKKTVKKNQAKKQTTKTKIKKAPVAKKTAPIKKAKVSKKPAVKKAPVAKKAVAKKAAVKKAVTPVKKAVTSKVQEAKPVSKKPELKVIVNPKLKAQAVTSVKTIEKTKIIQATTKSNLKGVNRKMTQPVEVRVIKPSSAGLFGVEPYQEKPGEEFMNEAHKNHFREILWRWKKELMEEVDKTKSHMQDGAARHPDPSDNATQEEEFNLELRTRDRERKLIKKIDEALERIDHDDYGYCAACGIEIGVRRLEARPTAEMCIDCKTLDEIKEKQTRG